MRKAGHGRRGGDTGEHSPVKRRKKDSDEKSPTLNAIQPGVFIPTRAPQYSSRYHPPKNNLTGKIGTISIKWRW